MLDTLAGVMSPSHDFVMSHIMTHIEELEAEISSFKQALLDGVSPCKDILQFKTKLWKGLKSIRLVKRECHEGNGLTLEQLYFINSITADAKQFACAMPRHWGIANKLHLRLDVAFRSMAVEFKKAKRLQL